MITTDQLYNLWKTECECFEIMDLRRPQDYESERIPGSTTMTLDLLHSAVAGSDPEKLIVLLPGPETFKLCQALSDQFENVVTLAGGISEWKSKGYPLAPLDQNSISRLSRVANE